MSVDKNKTTDVIFLNNQTKNFTNKILQSIKRPKKKATEQTFINTKNPFTEIIYCFIVNYL